MLNIGLPFRILNTLYQSRITSNIFKILLQTLLYRCLKRAHEERVIILTCQRRKQKLEWLSKVNRYQMVLLALSITGMSLMVFLWGRSHSASPQFIKHLPSNDCSLSLHNGCSWCRCRCFHSDSNTITGPMSWYDLICFHKGITLTKESTENVPGASDNCKRPFSLCSQRHWRELSAERGGDWSLQFITGVTINGFSQCSFSGDCRALSGPRYPRLQLCLGNEYLMCSQAL